MNDIFEIVIDIIGELIINIGFEKKDASVNDLVNIEEREAYLVGLIATSVALCYDDDHRLDKHEKKMLDELIQQSSYQLSQKAVKYIKYAKRHKMKFEQLQKVYVKLTIDNATIHKITNDLESMIRTLEKDLSLYNEFLNKIRRTYPNERF